MRSWKYGAAKRGCALAAAKTICSGANPSGELTLPEALVKTIEHFVPEFWAALSRVKDPRHPLLIEYPLQQELLVAVLMFMVKVGSRRNIKYKLGSPAFVATLKCLMERYYPDVAFPDALFHGDTLNYVLKRVSPLETHGLRTLVIRSLLRKRCLEAFRLKGLYFSESSRQQPKAVAFGRRCAATSLSFDSIFSSSSTTGHGSYSRSGPLIYPTAPFSG